MIDRYNVKNPTIGTLYITATHIIFVDPETNKETWVREKLVSYAMARITNTWMRAKPIKLTINDFSLN